MGRIAADRRTSGRHMKAGWVIINSYWQKHGNGRASLSYIQQATGLDRKAAVKACRELDEWGHATRVPGIGTRPSEYVPHWVTSASGVQTTTTSDDDASGVQMTTRVGVESTPLDDASGVQTTTQTYLRTPAYRPAVQEVVDCSDGAATPPHAAGLSAASGETPQGGFEAFWNSYAHKQKRDKAEAAWTKLDPAPDLVAIILAEAGRWAEHYSTNNVEKRWRVLPHNWLAGKSWTCDLPIIHTDAKSAAIANVRGSAKPKPTKQASTAKPGKSPTERPVTQTVTIAAAIEVQEGLRKYLRISADGFSHAIVSESDWASEQEAGQVQLARLADAAGLGIIEDAADLIGKTVDVTWFGDSPMFSRSSGSENDPVEKPTTGFVSNPVVPQPAPTAPQATESAGPSKPKPKIQPREIPSDGAGKLAMLDRWRKSGFFEEGAT
jgi:hypothetical protein